MMQLAEDRVGALLRGARGWTVWKLDTERRPGRTPTFLAASPATGILLAVHCRTRRPIPSEWPDASWLPAVAVCWHPAMSPDIRRWLADPSGSPPGAQGDTTPEKRVWMDPFFATPPAVPRTEVEAFAVRAARETGWTPR